MNKKWFICAAAAFLLLGCPAGCTQQPAGQQEPAAAAERTVVTLLYPMPLKHFEALVETTYPDIDLQAEPSTTATVNGDSERRLRNGHGTDLIMTTLPTGAVQEYVMDLSAEEFADNYQATSMSPVLIGGQTRYLPLPGQYSGYILNATLAERLGKTLPASSSDLLALFNAGREQGLGIGPDGTMFGINVADLADVGTFIIGTQVPDFLGLIDGIRWADDFETGSAGFSGTWDNCLEELLTYKELGYLNSQALSLTKVNAVPVESRMQDGTMLLAYGNVRLFNQLRQSETYDFQMLPFLSDKGNAPWVISAPDGYLAVNRALSAEGREAELDASLRILSLLSTREGQAAWMTDTDATTSYLSDYEIPSGTVPDGLADCVAGGYVYNLRMPSSVVQYFGRSMISVLDGRLSLADALASVDDYCLNGSSDVDYDQSVVGSVTEDLLYENYNTRLQETAIGNLVADAVREYTGADLAVTNGGGIRASLYKGDVLGADLAAVCPYENRIIVVEAKGSVIQEMLRNGISQTDREENVPAGRFLQVSGFCYSFRPMTESSPAGLLSVTLPDGTALDPEKYYTLAINDYMAGSSGYLDNNGDGFTMLNLFSDTAPKASGIRLLRETDALYVDVLRAYFKKHQDEPISAKLEGRIKVVNENG